MDMKPDRAVDDLRAIREIMERTRRAAGEMGGWILVLWGGIWFVGFLGIQFLPGEVAGWLWVGLDTVGMAGSIWLGVSASRRGGVRSPVWRVALAWWLGIFVFDGFLFWLFDLETGQDAALLFVLSIALSYFLFGLFTSWKVSAVGVLLAVLAIGASLLLPGYFYLAMALLGGGLLMGSGLWFVRSGE